MNDENEILELDLDFDLQNVLPDDVVESLGLKKCKIESLLLLLKKGADSVKITLQDFDRNDMRYYHGIGKRYAAIAYEIYNRLFDKCKEPRLRTRLVTNRYSSTECHPDTIIFWADPDLIWGLYESLEKDGHYACP